MKVSTKKPKLEVADGVNSTEPEPEDTNTWDADPEGTGGAAAAEEEAREELVEQDVDRLIDADSNEYVLSRSKEGFALTLDPYLIQARPCTPMFAL